MRENAFFYNVFFLQIFYGLFYMMWKISTSQKLCHDFWQNNKKILLVDPSSEGDLFLKFLIFRKGVTESESHHFAVPGIP
jgi:hypothetical protein